MMLNKKIMSVLLVMLSVVGVAVQASDGQQAVEVSKPNAVMPVSTTVLANNNEYSEDKLNIVVSPSHPEFVIKLKSNATTGFSWFLRDYNTSIVEPTKHARLEPAKKLIGASGYEVWTFRIKPAGFKVPQQTTLRLIYSRPWASADSATQIMFTVTTL